MALFPLIATIVVSQYVWINWVFEMYLLDGPMAWFVLSLPYLIFNLLWVYLGKFLYQQKALTTPGLFTLNYGSKAGALSAIFLTLIFLPIMYIHMGASVLFHSFEIPLGLAAFIFILLSSISLFTGGFNKIVKADVFLFILVYSGLIVTLIYLRTGPLNCIDTDIVLKNESSPEPSRYAYLGWWLIALIVFIDPSIHQRLWATQNKKSVSKVMLGSIVLWLLFDLLIIGIISHNGSMADFNNVYMLAELFPTSIKLIFNFMLLAVILSTANTYFNISYNNIAFDLLKLAPNSPFIKRLVIAIILMAVCFGLSVFVYDQASVIDILFQLFPPAISALFLPFISIFIIRIKLSSNCVPLQMLFAFAVCLFFQINPYNMSNFATETPVAIGLLSSLMLQIIFLISCPAEKETKN